MGRRGDERSGDALRLRNAGRPATRVDEGRAIAPGACPGAAGWRPRVLVALDRCDAPDVLLRGALRLADGAAPDLVILQVLPEWSMEEFEAATRTELTHLATRLSSEGYRVRVEVRLGEPVQQIVAAARDHRADLIAMREHRRGILDRLFDTSALHGVLRESSIPVVVIGGEDGGAAGLGRSRR